MRSLLVTLLLLITVVTMYVSVAEGESGMNRRIEQSGEAMGDYIRGMSP